MTTIGIVGGSGLYRIDGLTDIEEREIRTPFGAPSDLVTLGRLGEVRLAFLPRHGAGHRLTPSEVPYRANIWALRSLGAEFVLAISAVGSMREEIEPGHVVVPDQLIDWTRGLRPSTFFGDGVVAHVQFADPYCNAWARLVAETARAEGAKVHAGGTLICMEGPQFSTRAESKLYRSWGVDIIGMTALPEAKLAREAELCYATLAMATDYDCWHEGHDDVSVEAVVAVLKRNTALAQRVIRAIATNKLPERNCACKDALRDGLMTNRRTWPPGVRERLGILIDRYCG